jgi:hypothetical protein
MGRDKFFDLLRSEGLLISRKRSSTRTTNSYHRFHTYGNIVKDMSLTRPNQAWASDITYLRTQGGFVYLSLLTDMYSRKIVGWHLSHEHHAHEPLPRPTFAPSIYTVAGQHFTVTVYVEIPQHGHPSSYLTQHGLHGFVLRYRKEGESEWREVHSTRLHVTLTFEEADQTKFLTLAAAWINPRLEHGPWSEEIKVLIN